MPLGVNFKVRESMHPISMPDEQTTVILEKTDKKCKNLTEGEVNFISLV